jgi:hypothetical protein
VGYLVSIEDVTPPARADKNPWTEAVIAEGEAIDGPWTDLATLAISPVDANPEYPAVRSFSAVAQLSHGWYRLTFRDAVGGDYAMNALPLFPKVFAPTIADVALLVRARTVKKGTMEQLGTFTLDTRPTAVEVQGLIAKAVAAVSAIAVVTVDSPPAAILEARNLAALYAAMLLELSYFPEQTNSEQSAYDNLEALYEKGILRLEAAMPDTASLKKGLYSLRMRSDVAGAGLLSTAELLP